MNIVKKATNGNGSKNELAHRSTEPFTALQREVDHAFDRVRRMFEGGISPHFGVFAKWPAVDVSESDKAVTLRADVPGLEARDFDVEVSGNALTIRGSRREEKKEDKKGFQSQERRFGSFSRTITLPSYADIAKLDARYDKGVLTVTVPKIPGQGSKRIAVKSA